MTCLEGRGESLFGFPALSKTGMPLPRVEFSQSMAGFHHLFALLGAPDQDCAVTFLHQAERQAIAIYQQGRHTEHMPAVVQAFRPKRATLKAQRLHHRAKRCIGIIERAVHLRRQARWHIPIVRVRQDLIATGKTHPPIAHRFARLDVQQMAHLVIGLAIHAVIPKRADERRISQMEPGAVGRQSLGCVGGGEKLGLELAKGIGALRPRSCTKTK